MMKRTLTLFVFVLTFILGLIPVSGAYKAHDSDYDTTQFLEAYPSAQGSKLDNCYLCHTGGRQGKKYLNSCDYCHAVYGFKPPYGDIRETLNPYGQDYLDAGRTTAACEGIADHDSDHDGFSNKAEILQGRLPGDKGDNPDVHETNAKVYTRAMLRALPETEQFMALDTAKAGDFYATYTGVDIWTLLQDAGISADATDITVYAADGYSRSFTVAELKKDYEQSKAYTKYPWISYPDDAPYSHEEQIEGILRYILAYERDGAPLQKSKIVADETGRSRLDGEGPYRFISPSVEPVVPDRSQYSIDRDDPPYPYNPNRPITRNADYCIKSVVAIMVSTKDNQSYQYDWNGGAWKLIEEGGLVVYGALK